MQPLIYYCRWHSAKLRLRGRDESAVWGELVYEAGRPTEWTERFRFDLQRREISVETAEGDVRSMLDEMGVVVVVGGPTIADQEVGGKDVVGGPTNGD